MHCRCWFGQGRPGDREGKAVKASHWLGLFSCRLIIGEDDAYPGDDHPVDLAHEFAVLDTHVSKSISHQATENKCVPMANVTYIGIIMAGIADVDTVIRMLLGLLAGDGLINRRAHLSRASFPLMYYIGGGLQRS